MKNALSALWAATPGTIRRDPTVAEIAGGFACGPADRELFNELIYQLVGVEKELVSLLSANSISPTVTDLQQVAKAIQAGRLNYSVAGGTANALTATLPVAPPSYVAGLRVLLLLSASNTGASTLNVNGLGAKAIRALDGQAALSGGEMIEGGLALFTYDGTIFQLDSTRSSLSALQVTGGRTQIFESGAGSWTVPPGVTAIRVRMNGGGGGGGGSYTVGSNAATGRGGGGGEYAEGSYTVTPGQALAYSVGAGGTGGLGSSTPGAGTNGGSSSLGGLISALGGVGGGAGLNAIGTSGGAGGTGGAGGGYDRPGGSGGFGILYSGTGAGGGTGGHSQFGGPSPTQNVNFHGQDGIGPGGGANGGGAASTSLSGNGAGGSNGGNGATGIITIQY